MKVKTIIFTLLAVLVLTVSCRVKDSCELNHTGTILVTNNLSHEIEVYVNSSQVFILQPDESKSVDKPIGSYTVNCYYNANEWNYTADVFECETATIIVPE